MAISGVVAGKTGVFKASAQPSGSELGPGQLPQWTCDQPSVVLAPSSDGFQLSASVPADATFQNFSLQVNGINVDGSNATSGPVVIPVLAAPAVPVQSFSIDQVS